MGHGPNGSDNTARAIRIKMESYLSSNLCLFCTAFMEDNCQKKCNDFPICHSHSLNTHIIHTHVMRRYIFIGLFCLTLEKMLSSTLALFFVMIVI